MPNTINYAEKYNSDLLAITNQQSLTSPFVTTNVKWLGAKTFHFTSLIPTGFQNHSRNGGWNKGNITELDRPFTVEHDRDISFLIDRADVEDSGLTATVENTSKAMQSINQAPEVDARFFEKVSAAAIAADAIDHANHPYVDVVASITVDNVVETIKTAISHVKIYRSALIVYVSTAVMDLLELAMYNKGKVEWMSLGEGPLAVETRVFRMDGVTIAEVINAERFGTAFTYSPAGDANFGFAIDGATDRGLQICCASLTTVLTVPKISTIYMFAPGDHTEGDGYLYQNRQLWDTFVLPNGKNGLIDSVSIVVANAAA